jgi:quinoprotein glucose dehydrogenase
MLNLLFMLRLIPATIAQKSTWCCTVILLLLSCKHADKPNTTWSVYRGDKGSTGYSALSQVNKNNLDRLEVAWVYHTRDAREGNSSTMECNPIIVNETMYVTSPKLKLIALDAATGNEKWTFDPFIGHEATGVNRGVTYWTDGVNDKRIFFSAGPYLYALNADSGKPLTVFGTNGKIDLRNGLGRDPEKLAVWATSPGIIYGDLLIQGTALEEGYDAAPGFVRAFNVHNGKTEWTFHTIPQPGEFGYDTWPEESYKEAGGTNSWTGMSVDEKRGIVFIPLGSPAFDFYGGNRKGENLFGNCLLALDAATGKRKWHYQLVHHDLWDYDLPAPPTLVTLHNGTTTIDAVAQVTKMGLVFLFDRTTGNPVFPIEERPVPKSLLAGEETWPTQPFPVKPPPFARQSFSESDITNISDSAHAFVKGRIGNARMGTIYAPPDTAGVVQVPGSRGGAEWGGASFDPETGILYVNANELPLLLKMKPVPSNDETISPGEKIYGINNCSMCHGANREGSTVFPSLRNLTSRLTIPKADSVLKTGKGQMPAYPNITGTDKQALLNFLFDKKQEKNIVKNKEKKAATKLRYVNNGWVQLTDKDGYPGIKPPWGTLNAIDLTKGELLWKVPLGEYDALTKKGIPPTGTHNLGGAVVTAGGLLIIAATADEKLRIFDKQTGKLLWQYKLPAAGYAMPSTYMLNGKQYIVIAAGGGGKVGTASGDAYVAFRLKE